MVKIVCSFYNLVAVIHQLTFYWYKGREYKSSASLIILMSVYIF